MEEVCESLGVSERRACRALSLHRSTHRYEPDHRDDESALTEAIIGMASRYGRYGYRRITAMLRLAGWRVNHKRVERIWRREGLKVPQNQPKRGRLWLNDGSVVRLRPTHENHVWSYDFMSDRTRTGKPLRILNVIDEYGRKSLEGLVRRHIKADDVIETLASLFCEHGVPEYIRSDNGPEFTSKVVRGWLTNIGVKTLFIEPGSPWENGYIESYNGKMRDEFLNREIFDTEYEAQVLTNAWRNDYNKRRPHSSLGYRPPAPETLLPGKQDLVLNRHAG